MDTAIDIGNQNDSDLAISYLTLRKMIGWIGLLMPFVVRLGALYLEQISTQDSISAYYYTRMHDIFVSTLVLVGILLTCYRSRRLIDNIVTIVAGLSAIGIGLFPMDVTFAPQICDRYPAMCRAARLAPEICARCPEACDPRANACYVIHGILGYHFLFVVLFFATAFFLVYFNFTLPTSATAQKRTRNKIYRICAALMAIAFVAIGILFWRMHGRYIFWPETVAVVAFGIAWLAKGQAFLKDPSLSAA